MGIINEPTAAAIARLMLFSAIFPTEIQTMDSHFLVLMKLIVVPLCHLRLYTQLTFILRESSGTNTEENVYENHVTQALNRI
ncbi:uncharacterized protein LOC113288508 isoform X2 [Papaver somniferum]|uniref:uncharacterized protein LOC113288508 isoform X2 n=1 Tax=Papaver somniferum TaxID=3469 RepID=UPI000E6F81BD|nr:uncharacterized protein LOC113288508 isoform X2 [Papaver somniferum]